MTVHPQGVNRAPERGGASGSLVWPLKMGAKLILSRLPVSRTVWSRLGIFRGGAMDDPRYAISIVDAHLQHGGVLASGPSFTLLELGPGESIATGIIAATRGIRSSYLVADQDSVFRPLKTYRPLLDALAAEGRDVSAFRSALDFDDLCRRAGVAYLTGGLAALRSIPSASVDFLFSNAVLEHVRRTDFVPTLLEMRRILRPGAVASHAVDLQDHLGEALNNLRFSASMWETDWMARSGFYTNRIRYAEMLELFREAGFEPRIVEEHRWERLPTPRARMAPAFRNLDEQDLTVSSFWVILR
jgi:SAM-dependent methyltransferase